MGCYITFFMSHQQICLELVDAGQKTGVTVAGTANKNKTGMQTKVDRLSEQLAKLDV